MWKRDNICLRAHAIDDDVTREIFRYIKLDSYNNNETTSSNDTDENELIRITFLHHYTDRVGRVGPCSLVFILADENNF